MIIIVILFDLFHYSLLYSQKIKRPILRQQTPIKGLSFLCRLHAITCAQLGGVRQKSTENNVLLCKISHF